MRVNWANRRLGKLSPALARVSGRVRRVRSRGSVRVSDLDAQAFAASTCPSFRVVSFRPVSKMTGF